MGATLSPRHLARSVLRRLGPGLITGASTNDPCTIATYSLAGAVFGFSVLWVILLMLPLLVAVQEISARIGRITGRGVADNIRCCYPAWLLYPTMGLLVISIMINLGADIASMGESLQLLVGGCAWLWAALFTAVCLLLQLLVAYRTYTTILKWLSLILLVYIATALVADVPWRVALRATLVPTFHGTQDYWATLTALLGTAMSPYMLFWQSSLETEEMKSQPGEQPLRQRLRHQPRRIRQQLVRIRLDTVVGMSFSCVVSYFIVLTGAATLRAATVADVQTSAQVAQSLRPLAGQLTFVLFAAGIIGTGLLAVPVLAGSAAYAVGEAMRWRTGLGHPPLQARGFYGVLATATIGGLIIDLPCLHINPVKALFWSSVINGVAIVPMLAVMMLMCHNQRILGPFVRISKPLKFVGWLAALVMAVAAAGLFWSWGHT